jgi:hypothetical protein
LGKKKEANASKLSVSEGAGIDIEEQYLFFEQAF